MKTFTEPKIVIAVSGDPRVGKTTLLLEFIDRLKAKSRFTPGSFCQLLSRGKKGRDKCVIGVVDDIIVGIGTKGDSATEIFRNFKFFQDSHCQIVFTAVRRKAEETSRMALEMILDHCQMLKFKEIEKAKDTSSVFSPKTSQYVLGPLKTLESTLDAAIVFLKECERKRVFPFA